MKGWLCLVAALLLVGCDSKGLSDELLPGAERVQVTTNPDQIAGLAWLKTSTASYGAFSDGQMRKAHTFARNVTYRAGGEVALIDIETGGSQYGSRLYVTVESYDRPEQDAE